MGKTIQAIVYLAYLFEYQGVREPHLIVAPKSTIPNWMNEFTKWVPFFRVVNLIPTKEYRDEILSKDMARGNFDVCITTYEALRICEKQLQGIDFHAIIFDEAHKLKNDQSQSTRIARDLHSESRFLLTGTPLQNNLGELWTLFNLLMPALFTSKDEFLDQFDLQNKKEDAKMTIIKKLHMILKPFMLRRTKDQLVNKLPDKIEINLSVGLSQL